MKQHHHHHQPTSNSSMCMYLPAAQQPPPADRDDDPSRRRATSDVDHRSVMKEMSWEQSLVTQLRAIVLPALQADQRSELVAQMFRDILDCSSKAMAGLQLLHDADSLQLVDDKKRPRRRIIPDDDSNNNEDVKPHPNNKHKRRRFANSVSLQTSVPHYDGHQWRKYGQKNITNEKHPRSYYRCTYRKDQDCKAAKTVQQQQQDDDDDYDESLHSDRTVMYTVVYLGQHTCTNNCSDSSTNDGSAGTKATTVVRSSSSGSGGDRSSVSGNVDCSACPAGLVEEENHHDNYVYEEEALFDDMAAFGSLELDSSWESLDVLLRFGP